jgi:hypothetical protein
LQAQQQQQQQQAPQDGAKVCPYFKKGNCKKGDQCNMSHQIPAQQSAQQQQPSQPEEKVCPYFKKGNCKKGDQCNMSHQLAPSQPQQGGPNAGFTPQPVSEFNGTPQASQPAEAKPCSFYKKGTCKKGDQCNFLHIQ